MLLAGEGMKVVTPLQMNEIDRQTIGQMGIPGIVLMENAAQKVVGEIIKTLGNVQGRKIAVFAGKGNNGGDAFAAARHLYNMGAEVSVYITSERINITGDASTNLNVLDKMDVEIRCLTGEFRLDEVERHLAASDLIVDGILGTGIKGEIRGLLKEIINIINKAGKVIISIDIPSGVSGETGKILGTCIKASKTVTFGLPKTGLVIHPGCDFTGELIIADIGIPEKVIENFSINVNIIESSHVSKYIPPRNDNSNKGDYGRIFMISGSIGMTGSGCLAARAALRSGAGLVYLGVPSSLASIYEAGLFEAITIPLTDKGLGYLCRDSINEIISHLKDKNVVAIGPGLSMNGEIFEVVGSVMENVEVPLILDADALNAISLDVSILGHLKAEAVITPHPGEMARLCGISIEEVQNNRIEVAREFALRWKVTTVLKGSKTVVAIPDGTIYINPMGNSGMAKGGSGDVLTGIIAGMAGQGVKPSDAAVAGVYLHGLAGDIAALKKGKFGMLPSDIIEELPQVIDRL